MRMRIVNFRKKVFLREGSKSFYLVSFEEARVCTQKKMELSSTLNISIKQGFSSYLKLLREKNSKSWWINLSRNCFEKMFEMKEDMAKWMPNGESKECLQMGTVTMSIKLFEGEYYMCIEKKMGIT